MTPWGHPRIQPIPDPLYVIATVSNPARYQSRYDLYAQFARHMATFPQVILKTVEIAFGDRAFEVTAADHPDHLRLRTTAEIWHKENSINLMIHRLPPAAKYVAWIDADVTFGNPDWADETLHQLQHHAIVQPWQHAVDLGPTGEPLNTFNSYCYCYTEQLDPGPFLWEGFVSRWHPGYAWAARRDTLDTLGGLLDISALGSGDSLMAHALIGEMREKMFEGFSPGFARALRSWRDGATAIRKDVGYVRGTIYHSFHGAKRDRNYASRREILVREQFDPFTDLRRDWQGLYQLTDRSITLRDAFRRYFRGRNEDGRIASPAPSPAGTRGQPGTAATAPIAAPADLPTPATIPEGRPYHHHHHKHHHHRHRHDAT